MYFISADILANSNPQQVTIVGVSGAFERGNPRCGNRP